MTEEFSLRGRRDGGVAQASHSPATSALGEPEPLGEAAWSLGGMETEAPPPVREEKKASSPSQPPFPMFPGLEDEKAAAKAAPGLDIMRFVRGLWARKYLILAIALGISLLFGGLAFTLVKRQWEAGVALIMHTHQDQFSISAGQPFKPQQYNLKTLLDTLKLPSSLEQIMQRSQISTLPRTLAAAIDVTLGKDSNIFHIEVVWNDPRIAATLANLAAEVFVDRSRGIRHKDAEDTFNYYDAQLREARERKRLISAELLEFQRLTKVADFDTETKVRLADLSRLESEYRTKVAETEAMHLVKEQLSGKIGQQPEMIVTSTVYRSPLKQRLAEYQWQMQEARSRYTDENPKVIKLANRISVLQQMIAESNDEAVPENTYSPNTLKTDLQLRLQEMEDKIRVSEAQVDALDTTLRGMKDKLEFLSGKEKEFKLISARLTAAETLEAGLATRTEEARLAMQRNEAAFEIIERATPPSEPMRSPKKLIVIAGVVLGLGAGVFIALLLEFFDPYLRTRRDLMDLAGVELAIEIERLPPEASKIIDPKAPMAPLATLFRRLVNDLDTKLEAEDWRTLAVISLEPEAGRSLTAVNLAQSLAIKERRVMLIDADLRGQAGERPARLLGLNPDHPGLLDVVRDGLQTPAAIHPTANPWLRLLPAGSAQPEGEKDLAALGGRRFATLVTALNQSAGYLIYDLPPLSSQETVLEAAALVGNALLVARSGQSRRAELKETLERLRVRGVEIRALAIADVPPDLLSGQPQFVAKTGRRSLLRRRAKTSAIPAPTPEAKPHAL